MNPAMLLSGFPSQGGPLVPQEGPAAPPPARRNFAVLAVDDDAADLELLGRHLGRIPEWKVDFLAFVDWDSAKPALSNPDLEAILLDVHLGAESGLDRLRELRQSGEARPIILLTGLGDEALAKEAMRAGADDYLNKRWLSPDTLRRSLGGALAQWQLRKDMAFLEEELRLAQRMDAIGHLAGGLAHDLNNLITGALAYLDLALAKNPAREVVLDLDQARRLCVQMGETVRTLLDFSRREGPEPVEVHLQPLLETLRSVLRHALPEGVHLGWDVEEAPILLKALPSQLYQVLLAVLRNGMDAIEGAGDVHLRLRRVDLDAEEASRHPGLVPGPYALLEVKDTGRGMDAGTLSRIFDPFFTTKGLDTSRGRGASLALTWRTVRSMGGTIRVESHPGEGSRFSIYLPIHRLQAEAASPPEGGVAQPSSGGRESILLVEDEPFLLEVVKTMLERLGYQVLAAQDGKAAIEFAQGTGPIGVVLLDLSMPLMDGRTCFRRLREIRPDLPVVFASGHDMSSATPELLALGAQGVIQKPYKLADLVQSLRSVLDHH